MLTGTGSGPTPCISSPPSQEPSLLEDLLGKRTRLVGSGYWELRPQWLQGIVGFLLIEPSTWIMQTRQFAGLKRRAERAPRTLRLQLGDGPRPAAPSGSRDIASFIT
jgi:hypothetical protein